jgi:type III secretion system needle length determinant
MTSKISDSTGRESRYGFAGNQTEGTRAPDGTARAEGRGDMFRETQSFRSFAGSFPDYSRGEPPRRQVSELSDIFSAAFAGRTDAPVSSQGSPAMEAAPAPAAPPSDAAAREEIMKIADTLVEKILVSDPQSTAGNQVMIKMSAQSQLSGTEILLTRSNDGTLAVVINSANDNQYRKLNEARERLEASLKKLERGSFTVTVNPPETQES